MCVAEKELYDAELKKYDKEQMPGTHEHGQLQTFLFVAFPLV